MADKMLGWSVTVDGVENVQKLLGLAAEKVRDLRPAFKEIVEQFAAYEMTMFSRSGAVEGWTRWRPLNPIYAAAKRAQGFRSKILVREGDLKRSLTDPGDPDFVSRISPLKLEVGTRDPKAAFHQRGTSSLPTREVLRMTEKSYAHFIKIVQKFLIENDQFERVNL